MASQHEVCIGGSLEIVHRSNPAVTTRAPRNSDDGVAYRRILGIVKPPGERDDGEMNWSRLGSYLSGALLASAVAAAFAPIAIIIVTESYNVRGWLKTGVWPPAHYIESYKLRLPHTSWIGLQRILDSINGAPGPIILLGACICTAILLFFLAKLVAEAVQSR
jgi:hypothetical protein